MRWLLLVLCSLSLSAQALDATYLTMIEPKGYQCAHQADAWVCLAGDTQKPAALVELKGSLLSGSKMTLVEAAIEQRKTASREMLMYQRRANFAGLDWWEAMKTNSLKGLATHQWLTVLPTQHGPFLITLTAGYPPGAVTAMDKMMAASLRSLRLSQHILDYVDYLAVPADQRDAALPQVVVGPVSGAKIPACATSKKMELAVGTGRLMAFPIRASGVAVIENTRALEVLPTHVPYIMSTLLFSPMAEGRADVLVFDRTKKCRVRYSVAINPDNTRVKAPAEWTAQTLRTPSSAAEANAEYQRLGTAVIAGHLEPGNPVAAIPFPNEATMWISDPRIFDTVKLKPEKDHASKLALIAKRPGTTTLVVLDPSGKGRGYRVTVDPRAMHVEPMPMGQYENEL